MEAVTVSAPQQTVERGWPAVTAVVTADGNRYEIFYRASRGPLALSAEPFLAAALLPAMKIGAPVHIAGPVSPRLLAQAGKFQEIMCTWYRDLHRVPVEAEGQLPAGAPAPLEIGCFFSGGIGSSYSALKRQTELAALVFVHSFDILLSDETVRMTVTDNLRQAAAELHKPLIEVETNVRKLLDQYVTWGEHSLGAALASVALALSPQFQKVYIPSSFPYSHLFPWGSHPLTDPLWSTERTQIVHDGCEASRWQKLERLAGNATARLYLRVCGQQTDGASNCCRCPSCLGVMAYLRLAGRQEQFPTFARRLDLDELAHMPITDGASRMNGRLLLEAVERTGSDPQMAQALHTCLNLPEGYDAVDKYEEDLQQTNARIAMLRLQIRRVQSSRSWRWTAPLRAGADLLRRASKSGQS